MALSRSVLTAATFAVAVAGSHLVPEIASGFSSGPPAGYAGAPTDNPSSCTACHNSYTLNSGTANMSFGVPKMLTLGTAHPITVGFPGSTATRHGFQVTMRDSGGTFRGNWAVTMTTPTYPSAQTKNATGNTAYHEHTTSGSSQSNWTMNWQAPSTIAAGPLKFFAAGNQSNNDGSPSGDHIYTRVGTMWQASLGTPSANWATGAVHTLNLAAPGHGGDLYVIAAAEIPGQTPLGGPFVFEATIATGFADLAWNLPSVFVNFVGVTNAVGGATASVVVPFYPALAGFNLHFAAVTADAAWNPTEVSNPLVITFN